MKKIILFILIATFFSCSSKNDEIDIPADQQVFFDNLRDEIGAEKINHTRIKKDGAFLENSLSIEIMNSDTISLKDSNLAEISNQIFIALLKLKSKKQYDFIEVVFTDGFDWGFYKKWESKRNSYSEKNISHVLAQINSPAYQLEEIYNRYNAVEQYDSLIIEATKIINDNPSLVNGYKIRGYGYYKLNDFSNSEKDMLKGRAIDKLDIDFPMNLAILYGDQKNYDKAFRYIDSSLTLNPEYPKAIFYRGQYRCESGDNVNGKIDLKKAESLGLIDPSASLLLDDK